MDFGLHANPTAIIYSCYDKIKYKEKKEQQIEPAFCSFVV